MLNKINLKKTTEKSLLVRITKVMFDYLKSGGSLNKAIVEIIQKDKNKQSLGIIGMGYMISSDC